MSSEVPYNDSYNGSINLAATTFVFGISWGIMSSLYSVCMYNLICDLRSKRAIRRSAMLTVWVTALWILSSISTISSAYNSIYAYSWKNDYPGGPTAYLAVSWNGSAQILASTTYTMTTWFADAMMLWRLVIFLAGVHPFIRNSILSLMFLIYIGLVGFGCSTILLSTGQTLYGPHAKKTAILYFTLSVTLNVLATAFISLRLLLFKREMERTMGREEIEASPYTSIATMVIESSMLYATWSLMFIILFVIDVAGETIMLMTLCNVQVIAPLLIVYRVSKGVSWEQTEIRAVSRQMIFAENPGISDTCSM